MNFDFSEEVTAMRQEVRRFLRERLPPGAVRQRIDAGETFDRALWSSISEMGWLGAAIPEAYGGAALGYEALCMLAEEVGAAVPPVPFSSSIYLTAEALLGFGSEAQKRRYLPELANGSLRGTFALAEGPGDPAPGAIKTTFAGGVLTGTKIPVFDACTAELAIVAARSADGSVGLYVVELAAAGIVRQPLRSLDLGHAPERIIFELAPAEILPGARGWSSISRLLDRAAILFAFEQVGGAQAALDMAVAYANDRYAFGRPIASFQAIKHKLADIYVAVELARSNAYFGAWALDSDAPELPMAAAAARLAATEAFQLASRENIQTHGGMGFTWESDCHLFYRHAKQLAGNIGSPRHWRDRLLDQLTASSRN